MRTKLATLLSVCTLLGSMLVVANVALAANQAADLDQCANGALPSAPTDGCDGSAGTQWVNGNLGESKSVYREGDSIAYRLKLTNIATGAAQHTVKIEWDTTKSGKHAIDYLTTWNRTVANANPCLGVANCVLGTNSTFPIPKDPQVDPGTPAGTGAAGGQPAGVFTIWGGTINSVSPYTYSTGTGFAGDKSASIVLSFTASRANPVIAWGGHIASRQAWGNANSAVAISGSPYHTRLLDLDGSGGNQDRSLSAAAVIFPARITVFKNANGTSADFTFTGADFTPNPFVLTDGSATANPSKVSNEILVFGNHTVSENSPLPGYKLGSIVCSSDMNNANNSLTVNAGGAGGTATIGLEEGENVICTFNNLAQNSALSIAKDATETSYSAVGQTIHYTIVATNTGNTTLASVTITDTEAVLGTCTPANGSSLAPGATITCAASHVVTQADIDAGTYNNTACVDDGAGGAAEVCDDADVPSSKSPSLSILKTAATGTYDSVGDVITFTIVATNTGNTTLAAVTVTDDEATLGTCVPANGSSLAPGAEMTCSATYTITQADIDAGTRNNTACVDDGTGGATEACDDVDVPVVKSPALSILKTAAAGTYDSVGDVITFTIVAKNTGNTTLAAVTVTDLEATLGTCVPANGSSLAPGAEMTCSATYTITQADIDAGTRNNTACVDDGAGGAAEVCDDVDVPVVKSPALSIVKVDDYADGVKYEDVGDVINYTITATNTGNVTLFNVDVTDPLADNLACVPVDPVASLAPGASIVCTASHTITQADLTAGSFLNTACVDDGAAGAAEACDDETTPGKAQPTVATTDTFIPQDSIVLSGLTADATGTLYVELRINETCGQDATPAYSKTWTGAAFTGTAGNPYTTDNTVAVGADATIRWCTSYSGDANNANIPLGSHGEISQIDFDPAGILGVGFGLIPMVVWALWSRRRREENAA
jgi:uncharacterized repeat protein (TIGR01451 family)